MEQINNLIEWATNEVVIATKDETEEVKKYYEAALNAFKTFVKFTEGFESCGVAKTILIQLLHDDVLSPIEENKINDWSAINSEKESGITIYQCKRRPSLFKKVTYDSGVMGGIKEVKFTDNSRAICIDITTEQIYQGGIGQRVFDEIFPIQFPYSPIGRYKIFTEEYKDDKGDDYTAVLYIRDTDSRMVKVKRFFKHDRETGENIEVVEEEYYTNKPKLGGTNNGK